MEKNKKLNTIEVANMTIEKYGSLIETSCAENGCLKSWNVMKDYAKMVIMKKYGKRMLNSLSSQFFGYAAHYVFSHYVHKYGR